MAREGLFAKIGQAIDYLLDQPVIPIEVEKHSLALGFDHQYRPNKIDPNLDHLLKIRSLMPNYLFAD